MRKVVASLLCSAGLLVAAPTARAADPAPQTPAVAAPQAPAAAPQAQPAPASPTSTTPAPGAHPSSPKADAAEARYRAWSEREHAKDAAEFAKEKSKIEDKYKGYVRPKREKKPAGQDAPAPKTGN